MTAMQELASLKGELDRIKAESGLNAQAANEAQNAFATVTAERDSYSAAVTAMTSERDAALAQAKELCVKLVEIEAARADFAVSVENRAASIAVERLAAVGVSAPIETASPADKSREDVLNAYKAADAKGKREIYEKHRNHFSVN